MRWSGLFIGGRAHCHEGFLLALRAAGQEELAARGQPVSLSRTAARSRSHDEGAPEQPGHRRDVHGDERPQQPVRCACLQDAG
jgi:hypothetical protein